MRGQGEACTPPFCMAATVFCWRELAGITALVALCAGDGAAELFGASALGRAGPRIPWCKRKSLVGTVSFFGATLGAGTLFALRFARLGWWAPVATGALVSGLAKVSAAAALAESFDTGAWDNPLIFLAAAAAAKKWLP